MHKQQQQQQQQRQQQQQVNRKWRLTLGKQDEAILCHCSSFNFCLCSSCRRASIVEPSIITCRCPRRLACDCVTVCDMQLAEVILTSDVSRQCFTCTPPVVRLRHRVSLITRSKATDSSLFLLFPRCTPTSACALQVDTVHYSCP